MTQPYLRIRKVADTVKMKDFYEIQRAFYRYEKAQLRKKEKQEGVNKNESTEDGEEGRFPGEAQFRRWENHMGPRVYPSGDITLPATFFYTTDRSKWIVMPWGPAAKRSQ